MMDQSEKDSRTIAALMLRCNQDLLPRAQRLLAKVNGGDILSDGDIYFLKEVHADTVEVQALMKRDHDYGRLVAGFIDLVTEIISKGLENENTR